MSYNISIVPEKFNVRFVKVLLLYVRFAQLALLYMKFMVPVPVALNVNPWKLLLLIFRVVVIAPEDVISSNDLPEAIVGDNTKQLHESALHLETLDDARTEFEKLFIIHHLEKHHWNVTETADAIGERRDTLSKKIGRFGIKVK